MVTHRSTEHLTAAATAIRSSERVTSVVIVDNDSGDDTASVARSLDWGAPCTVVEPGENLGFGNGVNLAVSAGKCSSEFLLVLNPDAVIGAAGLERLRSDLEQSPRLACVGAQLRRGDGSPVSSARAFPDRWGFVLRRPVDVVHGGRLTEADWICGALMLWRRAAFLDVEGFAPDYFLYFEDTDICRRARLADWRVAIDGSVDAVHEQGHGRPTSAALRRISRTSRRRYARRWLGFSGFASALVADCLDHLSWGWHRPRSAA